MGRADAAGPGDRARLESMRERLAALRDEMRAFAEGRLAALPDLPPERRASAANLLHYLALRQHDVRELQEALSDLGLSSLGRSESRVLANLDGILRVLAALLGGDAPPPEPPPRRGRAHLDANTGALLGAPPPGRAVRIMVTMPSEAADDPRLVRDLLAGGMDCMRINCAHDGPAAWRAMIGHLEAARASLGRRCSVLMDLGGPKLRTGAMTPEPGVVRWRPRRDRLGRVLTPARLWLCAEGSPGVPPPDADAILPLTGDLAARLEAGDRLRLDDARGRRRELLVVHASPRGAWATCERTGYATAGSPVRWVMGRGEPRVRDRGEARVAALPDEPGSVWLRPGDVVVLTADPSPGRPGTRDDEGRFVRPPVVPCTLPEALADVRPGHAVWFDDGRIGGVVDRARDGAVEVRVTRVAGAGARLRADKGINLPDTALRVAALTARDREDLAFVVRHADLVGASFVRRPEDVAELREALRAAGGEARGLVLKIETREAFDHLPALLLEALRHPRAGVMIARGDLAVECGYTRMAEVQEEILWFCEAAHLPVIWATQVLEGLARSGMPSRAEVTDAAMGERAECVMLNKGPYIREALAFLDDVLRRMQDHMAKKSPTLRPLSVADRAVHHGRRTR